MTGASAAVCVAVAPQKVEGATLSDWEGPFFPDCLGTLQQAIDACSDWDWIESVAPTIEGYGRVGTLMRPITSEGHQWRIGYTYKLPSGGDVTLLFSEKAPDGESLRHCALYFRGTRGVRHKTVLERLMFVIAGEIRDD